MLVNVLWMLLGTVAVLGPLGEAEAAGGITLTRDSFTVQEKADFSWIYTVDGAGLPQGSTLKIYDPVFQGMRWSKWGDLSPWWDRCTEQSTDQLASWGLVSAHVRRDDVRLEDVTVVVSRSNCDDETMTCSPDVHDIAWTQVEVTEGNLLVGDEVVVGIGDVDACENDCTEGACGSCTDCGFEMPDRSFPEVAWPAEVCDESDECVDLEPARFSVLSLENPDAMWVTVPSQSEQGESVRVKVAILDRWGNAVTQARHTIEVHAPDGVQSYTLTETDGGWHDFDVTLDELGVHRIQVTAGALGAQSNPIEVLADAPEELILWGDIHVHHGYTWVDEDGGAYDLNHDYGRDVAGLDIVSQSQKAAGIEIGEDRLWNELQNSCRAYSSVDEYLVLLGFEWMGELASDIYGTPSEGHHNVYYDGCEAPLGTHDLETINSLSGDRGLWSWLAAVEEEYEVSGITVPHATRRTGYNFDVRNPGTQTLVEVYSEWGDSTEWTQQQSDTDVPGSTQDMLNSGLRLGWIGGSDNHDGWMGNPFSQKNEKSGLGAFIARRLSRPAVFDAMQNRRTYATSGHRPILRFRAEDGEHLMPQGSEYIARSPTLRFRYHGTADVEYARLYSIRIQDGAMQEVVQKWPGDGPDLSASFEVGPAAGQSAAYWLEVLQWDGERAWSSPIWVTGDCSRVDSGAEDPFSRCEGRDTGREGQESSKPLRCGCAQGAGGGWLWALSLLIVLNRRGERGSLRPDRG